MEKDLMRDIEDLMHKINRAMQMSREQEGILNKKRNESMEEVRPMMVEKMKEEIIQQEREKEDFDEMTKNAIIRAKVGILTERETSEKKYQSKLIETVQKQKKIKQKLESMQSKGCPKEKIEMAEKVAKQTLDKINKEMKDFQEGHFIERDRLNEFEMNINDWAIELGVEEELKRVRIADDKLKTGTPENGTPGTEVPGKETPGKETLGTEVPGKEVPGKETPGKETPGKETPGTEVSGTETSETGTPETEAPETEVPGTEVPGTKVPGTEVPGTEVPGTETSETEVPGTEVPGTETSGTEAPGKQTAKIDLDKELQKVRELIGTSDTEGNLANKEEIKELYSINTEEKDYLYNYRTYEKINGVINDAKTYFRRVPRMNIVGNMIERFRLLFTGYGKAAFSVDPNITKYLREEGQTDAYGAYCGYMSGYETKLPVPITYEVSNRFQRAFQKALQRAKALEAKRIQGRLGSIIDSEDTQTQSSVVVKIKVDEEAARKAAEQTGKHTASEHFAGPAQNPFAGPAQNPFAGPAQNPFAGPAQNPFAGPAQNPCDNTGKDDLSL